MENKYLIIKYRGKILSLLFHGNRLVRARAEKENGNILGNIYVAKVKSILKNIHAAFVEIEPGYPCFLSLERIRKPLLMNRAYDGRVLAEDEILVQVYKEAAKTKSPAVTCSLSLDGRYCAVSMDRPGVAYSSKLSEKARRRIREALEKEGVLEEYEKKNGIVIRTNAKSLGEDISPLADEIRRFSAKLQEIMDMACHRTCYSVLHEAEPAYLTAIRDEYEGQCGEIVTDDPGIYEKIMAYREANPSFHMPEARLYQDERLPLHKLYSVETRLQEALGKKVWLKSGGYLVIEPTEALTVIDVNTGKLASGKDMEQTWLRINMEATEEIALQLALRNISGIIIVDFINMKPEEHNKKLMSHFGNLLKQDAVRTELMDITALGLVEITRMKTSKPLREQLMEAVFFNESKTVPQPKGEKI